MKKSVYLVLIMSVVAATLPVWAATAVVPTQGFTQEKCEVQLEEAKTAASIKVPAPSRDPVDTMKDVLSVLSYLESEIIDQNEMTKGMVIAILTGGHILLVGPHGTGKSVGAIALGTSIEGTFGKVPYDNETMPSQIIGKEEKNEETGARTFLPGPLFNNVFLADELTRGPLKSQSALLEAMAHGYVTVGNKRHYVPEPFLVVATANPMDDLGTVKITPPNLDRFMLQYNVDYGQTKSEQKIMNLMRDRRMKKAHGTEFFSTNLETIQQAKHDLLTKMDIPESVDNYILKIIDATRFPLKYDKSLKEILAQGTSSRATESLDLAARAQAYIEGRFTVTEADVDAVIYPVLRHRLILTREAENDGRKPDDILKALLDAVKKYKGS